MKNKVRRSDVDRRKVPESGDEENAYSGPERRCGKERRVWVDRMQEIESKMAKRRK